VLPSSIVGDLPSSPFGKKALAHDFEQEGTDGVNL
jgi:hypothetical protein